jgi:hypothetical protein
VNTVTILAHGGTITWDEALMIVPIPVLIIAGLLLTARARHPAGDDEADDDELDDELNDDELDGSRVGG